jgi:hypothetical protein
MKKKTTIKQAAVLLLLCVFVNLFSFSAGARGRSSSDEFRYYVRAFWGADENLRVYEDDRPEPQLVKMSADFYTRFAQELKLQKIISFNKDGEKLTWPLQYPRDVSKIIIHHTASDKNEDKPLQAIKDIFYYHTMGRGWGDIGYNYIIDNEGNVYEGRYGGEGVVGAHAGPGNRGSIGVAVLGNYNEKELSGESLESLVKLISKKTKLHTIDPEGRSYFRGKKLPNIIGHNSVMPTSCPGENIIKLLPRIRKDVAELNGNYDYSKTGQTHKKEYDYENASDFEEVEIMPDNKTQYTVKLKNTGTKAWTSSTRLLKHKNAVLTNGLSVHPYNMQESYVAPGQTGTFKIKLYSKLSPGFYYQTFTPEFNGIKKASKVLNIPTIVEKPVFRYEIASIDLKKNDLRINEKTRAVVALKNTGNVRWKNFGKNRVSLGSDNPRDRISDFTDGNRMGYLNEFIVEPGEIGHFVFNIQAPETPGTYEEYFSPVIEGITWLDGKGMKFNFKIS